MVNAISIALSGLHAAVKKLNAGASNIANMGTVGALDDPDRAPYTPLETQQTALSLPDGEGAGVVSHTRAKAQPFTPAYDPDSPFANEEGLIGVPHVDLAEEAVNLKLAETSYKAGLATIKVAEEMSDELLGLFDDEA
jgi:flagellar basal-body rod protein FlgC